MRIEGGTLDIDDNLTLNNVLLAVSAVLQGDAVLTIGTNLSWTGGSMLGTGTTLVPVGKTLALSGPDDKILGRTLNNQGTITFGGTGNLQVQEGAVLTNRAGALFDIQNDALIYYNAVGNTPTFNNAGTLRKSAGTGTSNISTVFHNQGGTIDVRTGTLTPNASGTYTGTSTFTVSAGAVFVLGGNTPTVTGTLTGTGLGTVQLLQGQTVNVGAAGVIFNFDPGVFQWKGGSIQGDAANLLTIPAGKAISLSGVDDKFLAVITLRNQGQINWRDAGNFQMQEGAFLDNRGVFNIQNNQLLYYNLVGNQPLLDNLGTIVKAGAGSTGTTSIGVDFFNRGTVDMQNGTLQVAEDYTQTSGITKLNTGTILESSLVSIQGGTLAGTGKVIGDVTNNGTVSPGASPGTLQITGNYTQTATGKLNIEIGGTATTQFDRLLVSGTATLAGTLNVSQSGSFVPAAGNSFTFLTFATRSGDFTTPNGLRVNAGLFLDPLFSATGLRLLTTATAPLTLTVPTGGLAANHTLTLRRSGSILQVVNSAGTVVASKSSLSTSNVQITGSAADNDTLKVDFGTAGAFVDSPFTGLTFAIPVAFAGGAGGSDVLTVFDAGNTAAGPINYTITASQVTSGIAPVSYSSVEFLALNAGSGKSVINVSAIATGTRTTINGGAGDDTIAVASTVTAGVVLDGSTGNDSLTGGAGNDTLTGGAGSDRVSGGAGDDLYLFAAATATETDTVLEVAGEGTDKLDFSALTIAVTVGLGTTSHQPAHTNRILVLTGAPNIENLTGGSGNDHLLGNPGANVLMGGAGSDRLEGGAGDDVYVFAAAGVAEADTLVEAAGAGIDRLDFSALPSTRGVIVNLAAAASASDPLVAILASHPNATIKVATGQPANFENVTGGAGNDSIVGNGAANILLGGAGNDTLEGGAGSDRLEGGAGNDVYVFRAAGTAETDTLVEAAGAGIDRLDFSALPSTRGVIVNLAAAASASDPLVAILASHPNATIKVATGQPANFENVTGGAGNDSIVGNGAANILLGGAGNDTLEGGAGSDRLEGGAGNDVYVFRAAGTAETDTLVELAGGGTDKLDFSALPATRAVTLNLASTTTALGSALNHTLLVGAAGQVANFENVTGGAGNDILIGNAAINVFSGGGGNDVLSGGSGNDVLSGDAGRDILLGGAGADRLDGGADADLVLAALYLEQSNTAALQALMAEWGRADATTYAQRIDHLMNGGGLNGNFLLKTGTGGTVSGDGSDSASADTLTGGSGQDWFFARLSQVADILTDRDAATETVTDIP